MSKRIILLIASLAVVIGLMNCGDSYAWFVTAAQKKQSISVSVVSSVQSSYLTDLDLSDSDVIIMQGDNLVSLDGRDASLKIENKSTADTQIRVAVEYTSCKNGKAEQVRYSASEDDDITVEFADGKWAKNVNAGGDCYFYYVGDEFTGGELDSVNDVPSIGADIAEIDVIKSIFYNNDISDSYSGQRINVKVIFESKQADNVTWSTVDEYGISGVSE